MIPFLYGPDSAARHRAAGVPVQSVNLAGFARDVDSPDDLRWLLTQRIACATLAWLKASGIVERVKNASAAGDCR